MSDKNTSTASVKPEAAVTEKPGSPFFLFAGIICAAATSLFFNLYADVSLLDVIVALPAGFAPPFMTVALGHSIKDAEEKWLIVIVFLLTIGAMVVSAQGTVASLAPEHKTWNAYLLAFVLDGSDLVLLYLLIKHYQKVRTYKTYKAWLAGERAAGRAGSAVPAPVTWVRPDPVLPAPAAGTTAPAPAPAPAAGTTAPAPGTGPAPTLVPGEDQPGAGTAAQAARRAAGRAVSTPGRRRPGRSNRPAALCAEVTRELAARERPAIEDTKAKVARAAAYMREFQERTGVPMNAAELGTALHTHKSKVKAIRAAIPGTAAGEGLQEEQQAPPREEVS